MTKKRLNISAIVKEAIEDFEKSMASGGKDGADDNSCKFRFGDMVKCKESEKIGVVVSVDAENCKYKVIYKDDEEVKPVDATEDEIDFDSNLPEAPEDGQDTDDQGGEPVNEGSDFNGDDDINSDDNDLDDFGDDDPENNGDNGEDDDDADELTIGSEVRTPDGRTGIIVAITDQDLLDDAGGETGDGAGLSEDEDPENGGEDPENGDEDPENGGEGPENEHTLIADVLMYDNEETEKFDIKELQPVDGTEDFGAEPKDPDADPDLSAGE